MRTGVFVVCMGLWAVGTAAVGPWDADLSDFPRQADETGDSARIRRAVEAAGKGGVVWFRRGEKAGRLIWRDNQPFNFAPEEMKGLEDELKKSGETERAAKSNAQMAG